MRLIKLILHPFAGTVNKTYDFHSGLNVIHGQNEAGKSTIVKALQLALLTSTNLTKTELKSQISSFIPIGGDTINIDLNFEVGGIEYELKNCNIYLPHGDDNIFYYYSNIYSEIGMFDKYFYGTKTTL